jgi:hypothetical protein
MNSPADFQNIFPGKLLRVKHSKKKSLACIRVTYIKPETLSLARFARKRAPGSLSYAGHLPLSHHHCQMLIVSDAPADDGE